MDSTPALFVGGPWDGTRFCVEHEYQRYSVSTYAPPRLTPMPEATDPFQPLGHLEQHVYTRMSFVGQVFYVIEGAADEAKFRGKHIAEWLVAKLFEGYRVSPAAR